ncbi:spore maturation protein CgeB [Lachnospiraceae bacterium]|nr:spore maturation protein CgeB [Lachnospiraceae bacterium]
MNILFYRYNNICEPDIIAALNEFGYHVFEITDEITNKGISAQESIRIVSDFLLERPIDAVFSINFFPSLSEVCNIFKLRYLCWIVDSPVMELYATSIKNPYNRVFIFDRVLYEEISPLNPDCIFYLPLGTNVKSKDNIILSASSGECQKFSAEISFVGSLYTEKCAYDRLQNPPDYLNGYLNAIMDAQQKIYGYYFIENVLTDEIVKDFKAHFPYFYSFPAESYLTDKITLSQLYIGNKITAMERLETMKILSENFTTTIYTASDTSTLPYLHNKGLAKTITEMPIIFHESKININTTSKAIRSALPLRIWDILGSGGFVLSNYQEEIPQLLTIGEHLDIYSSMDELADKCRYYLSHDKERKEIAENGYKEVREHHTYEIRLAKLFSLAFQ